MKIDIFNTNKKYNIIYADPPWAYQWGKGKDGGNFAPEKHYPTMSTKEICDMKDTIKQLADKNCALLMWATMPCLPDAIKVIESWGFKYKTCAFTWVKVKKDGQPLAGMGSYTKSNAEICLLAMRGHAAYLRQLILDLKNTLKTIRAEDVLRHDTPYYHLNTNLVRCDYLSFLETGKPEFHGEYMTQYSWAEATCAMLQFKK